jgi:hypothetical protein
MTNANLITPPLRCPGTARSWIARHMTTSPELLPMEEAIP